MLNRLRNWMAPQFALDLGTTNTLLSQRGEGVVLNEPSVLALQKGSRRILGRGAAVGKLARQMIGRTPDSIQTINPLRHGVITDYGQDVKACALGQASAAIVGANVVGLTPAEIQAGRDALFAMLKQEGPVPPAPFADLEVLQPAKDYKNRHASIMLAFDATLDALSEAQATA